MKLKVLSLEDCEQVRLWRNDCLETLRTPFPLTREQQIHFYHDVVCDRNARARYFGVWYEYPESSCRNDEFIGMVGLENIEWENCRAEISIILSPENRGQGYGKEAIDMLLDKGFNQLGLRQIWGEYFHCNPAKEFWQKIIKKYHAYNVEHKCIKFWNGEYWNSTYFSIDWKEYLKTKKGKED